MFPFNKKQSQICGSQSNVSERNKAGPVPLSDFPRAHNSPDLMVTCGDTGPAEQQSVAPTPSGGFSTAHGWTGPRCPGTPSTLGFSMYVRLLSVLSPYFYQSTPLPHSGLASSKTSGDTEDELELRQGVSGGFLREGVFALLFGNNWELLSLELAMWDGMEERTFQEEDTEYEKAQRCMPIWETAEAHCNQRAGGLEYWGR